MASKRDVIHATVCLVGGCTMDLKDSGNYYQRHKVCELHAKSRQVLIKGQNLRFCQQCSRFHLLEEFDEGKRSCRKRLDVHNQRRRRRKSHHDGPQMQPTKPFTNPHLRGVGEASTWVDHSKYAPSLLSCSGSPAHESSTTLTHVRHIQTDSGSVSTTANPLDPRLCYGGMGNGIDLKWGGMTNMGPQHHASFDNQDPQIF